MKKTREKKKTGPARKTSQSRHPGQGVSYADQRVKTARQAIGTRRPARSDLAHLADAMGTLLDDIAFNAREVRPLRVVRFRALRCTQSKPRRHGLNGRRGAMVLGIQAASAIADGAHSA